VNVWLLPELTETEPEGLIDPPVPTEAVIVYVFTGLFIFTGIGVVVTDGLDGL
jgi:hypothetical protein